MLKINANHLELFKRVSRLKDINWNSKAILISLIEDVRHNGSITISYPDLSYGTKVSNRTITRAIANLSEKNYITLNKPHLSLSKKVSLNTDKVADLIK